MLAIEDRRFYDHPGVDPIGIVGAVISNLRGKRAYIAGASTITQQVVRNVFLPQMFRGMTLQAAREKSWRRKLLEMWVSLILTARAPKDEILEMYLNDVTLGQRGSFAIVGVAEAARLFFGKDVSNVSLAEAATIAGVIPVAVGAVAVQQPGALPGSAQRRAAGDGRRRLHHAGRRRHGAPARAARRRRARARSRSAVLRRLRRSDARRAISRA